MPIETNVSVKSQSRDGRQIRIKDSTGLVSAGRVNGYTEGDLTSILGYYYQLSRVFNSIVYTLKIDGTDAYLPIPEQIARGREFALTTDLFKVSTEQGYEEPCDMFQDGILNLNQYSIFAGLTGVTILKDTNYIVGGNFQQALKADVVVVNDKIYSIDKSPNYAQQGYGRLFITGVFEEDATTFNVAYQANTKVLLLAVSENLSSYACKQLRTDIDHPDWRNIHTAIAFRESARLLFTADVPDIYAAEELVVANCKLLKKFIC